MARAFSLSGPANLAEDALQASFGLAFAAGLTLIVLGLFAFAFPLVAALSATIAIGAVLVLCGAVKIAQAFQCRPLLRAIAYGMAGAIYFTGGAAIAFLPAAGAAALTLTLAILLIAGGLARILAALVPPRPDGWGWILSSGAVSMTMGAATAILLPFAALVLLGFIVAADIICAGAALLIAAIAASRPPALPRP